VDLRGAQLDGAFLNYSNLKQANLSGSSIQRFRIIGARLAEAIWIDGKVCSSTSVGSCE
jgi:uncharacterized protein YjbI with pentapeptide repeats